MDGMSGGNKLMEILSRIDTRLASTGSGPTVSVGFLAGATYPDGASVAEVAATQEFGGTINRAPGETTIYRMTNASATGFLRNGRFVKKAKANFATVHAHGAYKITIPPRPFFRTMIKKCAPGWGAAMAKILLATGYDGAKTMALMGDLIKGQLQASIKSVTSPALAATTVRRKGFSKPLIDTGHMWNSVDYRTTT